MSALQRVCYILPIIPKINLKKADNYVLLLLCSLSVTKYWLLHQQKLIMRFHSCNV